MSVKVEIPIASARIADAPWPIWMTRLRSTLSATAPPNRASVNMGIANPALTIPRSNGEFVSS